jgi:hypothetical protein
MMQSFSVVPIKQIQIIADGSLSVSSYFPSRERVAYDKKWALTRAALCCPLEENQACQTSDSIPLLLFPVT